MKFQEYEASEASARLKISIDGDLGVSDFALYMKAVNFYYRYKLFLEVDDLEVRTDRREEYSRIIANSSPRALSRPLNLELLANLDFVTSKDIRYALFSPTVPIGVRGAEEVHLNVETIQYASPGYIVISGIAGAIESVFKLFSSAIKVKNYDLERRILEETLISLQLDNYSKMLELAEQRGISAEEVRLLRSEGSIITHQLVQQAMKGKLTDASITRRNRERQFEES